MEKKIDIKTLIDKYQFKQFLLYRYTNRDIKIDRYWCIVGQIDR